MKIEKVAIFDYDNTLSEGFALPEICMMMEKRNLGNKGFNVNWKKMLTEYENGTLPYNDMVIKSSTVIADFLNEMQTKDFMKFVREEYDFLGKIYDWVPDLFEQLKNNGWLIAVISGATSEFLEVVQETLDYDFFWGTNLEKNAGSFTKKFQVIMNNLEKARVIKELKKNISFSIGIGDSEGDLEFLKIVDKAFVYNPKMKFASELSKNHKNITILTEENIQQILKTIE